MQFILRGIALAAAVVSTIALAERPTVKHVATTEELIELCSVGADDPSYAAAMGFCLGYLDAALDYHMALTSGEKFEAIVCPDPEVTREEVAAVFVDWSRANPQLVGSGPPVDSVMRAVYEKWPCSAQ
jgi:hypothetical protein